MKNNINFTIQIFILISSFFLFIIKLIAWYFTNSLSILSDALESIVNIVSAIIGLICLYISNFPIDINHPNGYGKIEYISSFLEGIFIFITGIIILFESLTRFFYTFKIININYGILFIIFTSIFNYILGFISIKYGHKNNSMILISSGKHLITDTYSSIGVTISLILINITKVTYIDLIISFIYGSIIINTGYQIIRKSISYIIDETNYTLLTKLKTIINNITKNNKNLLIDNIKIINYGNRLHVDCIIYLRYNINSKELICETKNILKKIKINFKEEIDFFFNIILLEK